MNSGMANRMPALDRAIGSLAVAVVVLMMTVSPMALGAIGWNYDAPGGAAAMRFHPATYLAMLLLLVVALRDGNPVASLLATFAGDARLALYLVAWSVVFYHGTANQGLPAAALIDTFLLPLVMLIVFQRLGGPTRARIATWFHIGFALNAIIGLAEFATGLRLTPYIAGGVAITDDWRSTALLGHPLGNALLTGCYTAILLVGGGQDLAGWRRTGMIVLQCAAMVAFGGRASLVLLVAFLAVRIGIAMLRVASGARAPLPAITVLALVLPLALGGIGLLVELGFFDRFLLRFTEDKGSAEARVVMFELFRGFTWPELLFGPSQTQLGYFVHVYRLEFGIESLWVAFSLYYGILPAILFFTGLAFYLASLMSGCQSRGWLILGYFFLVNSTFLGLAGKTIGLASLSLMLLALMPRISPPGRLAARGRTDPALIREHAPC